MTATDEVHAALAAARKLPGWTVNRLTSGAYRVTSPTGMGLVPAFLSPDTSRDVLTELDELGLDQDLTRRFIPAPPPPPQSDLVVIERETLDVPTATTTKTKTKTGVQRQPNIISFKYPDKPQVLPLDQLLPEVYKGQGRLLVPQVVINREIAEAFFERRAEKQNRRLRPSNKRKFVRLITENEFDHTHQGVAFNEDGENSDGQHRMWALCDITKENPDVTIVVDITYNAPRESARAYDGGANRNNVDRLQVAGIEHADRIAPLVRLLYLYEAIIEKPRSWKEIPPLTEATLIDWSEKYGPELFDCWETVRKPLRGTYMNLNIAAVCRYLALEQWDKSPIDDFIEAVGEDTMRGRGTPQRALANWLRNNYMNNKRTSHPLLLAMFLVAYNDFCQGNERTQMKWLPGDGSLPLPYAPESKSRKK